MWFSKNIVKFLFLFFAIISFEVALGHNPSNSTTLLIEGKDGSWMLQIRASLTAFEQEVHIRYSKDSYKTPEEFRNLVKKIIATDFGITINNTPVTLENGQVKLGHETVVVYQFKKPQSFNAITVKNQVFKNVFNAKNTLFIVKKGIDKNKFELNRANNFFIKITVKGNNLIATTQLQKTNFNVVWSFLIVVLITTVFGYIYKKKLL